MRELAEQLLPIWAEFYEQAFPFLTEALEELQPHLEDLGEALGDLIAELGPLIAELLRLTFTLAEELGPVVEPVARFLIQVFGGALSALTLVIRDYVIPAVEAIVLLLNGDFQGAMVKASEISDNFSTNATNAFENFRDSAGRALASFILNAVTGVQRMALEMLEAVMEGTGDVTDEFAEMPGRIRDALGKVGLLLYAAGGEIVQGLINGIVSRIGDLMSTVRGLASDVASEVAGVLQIFSPSRVMEGLGEDTAQGFINGLDKMAPVLMEAARNMARTVPTAVRTLAPTDAGTDPVFRPVLAPAAAPTVFVTIGNQAVDQYVTTRVRQEQTDRERTLFVQGVRP